MSEYGEILIKNGQYEEAIYYFTDLINSENNISIEDMSFFEKSDIAWYFYSRGICYLRLHIYENAIRDFTIAIEYADCHMETYYNRGVCYMELEQYQKAIEDYTKVIQLVTDDEILCLYAHYDRGVCYFNIEQYIEAIKDYTETIKLDPNYESAYVDRGICYVILEQYEKAIQDFGISIKLNSDNVEVYYKRGVCYFILGHYNEAINDFSKTIDLYDEEDEIYLQAYLRRIDCYVTIEDYENAIEDCEYLLDNEETFEEYAEYDTFNRLRELYDKLKENNINVYNIDNNKLKWYAHMKNAGEAIKEIHTEKILAEYLRAYAIDGQRTVIALKTLIDHPDFSYEHKEIFMQVLHLLTKLQENISGMNKEKRVEFVEQFLEEQKKCCSIDFSKLHYNPTQGRKLDI